MAYQPPSGHPKKGDDQPAAGVRGDISTTIWVSKWGIINRKRASVGISTANRFSTLLISNVEIYSTDNRRITPTVFVNPLLETTKAFSGQLVVTAITIPLNDENVIARAPNTPFRFFAEDPY